MATLTAGGTSSATLTLDAFASVTVVADASCNGALSFVSDAQNLLSNKTAKVQNKTYGPYGVPGTVTISITAGSLTYTVNGNTGGFEYDADGNIVGLVGAGGTIYGTGASYTWATLPAASTLSGVMVFVSDVGGGTYWRSNGTRWRPLNNMACLGALGARVSQTGSAEYLYYNVKVPAGAWKDNDRLRFRFTMTKSSTAETATMRVRVGQLGTVSDAAMYLGGASATATTSASLATTNNTYGGFFDVKRVSATSLQKLGSGSFTQPYNGATNAVFASAFTVADMDTNDTYFNLTVSKDAGVEAVALEDMAVELVATTA